MIKKTNLSAKYSMLSLPKSTLGLNSAAKLAPQNRLPQKILIITKAVFGAALNSFWGKLERAHWEY